MSNADELWDQGNGAADAGDHVLAAKLFRQAIDAGLPLGINLGNSLRALGDLEGAIGAYSPDWANGDLDAGFNLAVTLENVDVGRARAVYEQLVTAGYSKANVNLAWIEREDGSQNRAEELIRAVIDEDSETGRVASAILGVWYGMQGKPDSDTSPLLKRGIDYPDSRADYALVVLRAEGEAAAMEILEVGAARGEAASLIVLGNIHWDADRVEKARAAYRAGAAAGDSHCSENLASLERHEGHGA